MNHIVDTCPLTKFECGLNLLHEADDDDCSTCEKISEKVSIRLLTLVISVGFCPVLETPLHVSYLEILACPRIYENYCRINVHNTSKFSQ